MMIFSPINKLINSIKKIFLEVFIFDRRVRRVLKGNMAKSYLKKYAKKIIKDNNYNNITLDEIDNYTIWQFWDKGIENAPQIVKQCVKSIDKFEPNKRHIVLDMATIKNYVDIPQKYYDMVESGKMKMAHFSDLLRTMLLIKHGGCWIDSTVLLTDKLPDYICNSNLFIFKNYAKDDLDGLNLANYFIHSKPNHKILLQMRDCLYEYWESNSFVVNYFFYLHLFTLLTEICPKNKKLYEKTPFTSFIPVQHFQSELLNKYCDKKWEQIKSTTSIHKLSFKHRVLGLKDSSELQGTFYEKLLNGELV